jgi:cytosine deaminase
LDESRTGFRHDSKGDAVVDLIVRNARTSDTQPPVDLVIEAGTFARIGSGAADGVDARQTIDAGGRAVVPGFLEPHIHLDKALLERRRPNASGTLAEAIRITGELKAEFTREDTLERARRALEMSIRSGTTALRTQPDVDPIQGLLGVETMLELRQEYGNLVDLQIVAFPQEGIIKAPGVRELMIEAMRLGADVSGGCSYNEPSWEDTKRHVDTVFDVAEQFGAPVDFHADFADDSSDPRYTAASYIADQTIARGMQGRVSLGHMTSLGALTAEEAKPIIERLAEANISIIALPATDLYLGGRKDPASPRRGIAPIRRLRSAGVNVAYSTNNVRNAFTPFGKADPLQMGSMLAHVAHMGSPDDQAFILAMATTNAARAMGVSDCYGIEEGKAADFVVLDTEFVADAILDIPVRSWVVKRGNVTVVTEHRCTIHRPALAGDRS